MSWSMLWLLCHGQGGVFILESSAMTDLGKTLGAVQSVRTEAAREAALAASQRAPKRETALNEDISQKGRAPSIKRSIPDPVFLKPLPLPHGAAATKALLELDGQTPGAAPRTVSADEAAQAYVQRALPGHDRVSFLKEQSGGATPGDRVTVTA